MICWYCYWGWPEQIVAIYNKYKDLADLEYGKGHIVWSDENFANEDIQYCIDSCNSIEDAAVEASLRELLAIPENIRYCEPENYDGEFPENFPPPQGLVMVNV